MKITILIEAEHIPEGRVVQKPTGTKVYIEAVTFLEDLLYE